MTLVTRQAMADDSGTFTDGTEVDKTFVDQIYGQIDDQAHSATNPTIKPKATTDEVVAARGSKASLDARLDISLEEDGTLKTQAGLVSAAQYQAALGSRNVALNGDLDDWSAGASSAPDDWTLTTVTIARTGAGQADTTQFGTGLNGYAAKLTRAGADGNLKQIVISTANFTNFANVKGQKFGVSMKAKTSVASACRIVVDDGVSTTASSFHTGGNTEEHLSALHTISNTATKLEVYVEITGSNGDSYVGGFNFVFGQLAPSDWAPLSKEAPASATRVGLVSTAAQTFAGIKSFTDHGKFEPGTSSGTFAPWNGVVKSDITAVGNVGAGEDDLISYAVPANVLSADGKALRITCRGTFAATANTKRLRAYWGGTKIFEGAAGYNDSTAHHWTLIVHVLRVAASSEITWSAFLTSTVTVDNTTATAAGISGSDVTTSSVTVAGDTTTALTFKMTGEATANNDVAQQSMIIEAVG